MTTPSAAPDGPAAPERAATASPTIRDVAQRASVSIGTVSNVLNRPHLVSLATRRRVLETIEELGFVRSSAASQLRGGRSRSIGVVVLDVANPFFAEVLRGIEGALVERGYALLICSSDQSPDQEARHLRLLEEKRVEGVLITPARRATAHLERLSQRGIPFVMLDSPSLDDDSCSVAVDDVRGGELAIELLLARGHERLAFLNGPTRIRQCADRRRGVLRALRSAGLDRSALTEVTLRSQTPHEGDLAAARLLAANPRPTAAFCINDLVALGVLRRLRVEGLAVPGDMAVVGYDDIEVATIVLPELTSVRQPKYELGRVAADLLFSEIDDGKHRHRQVLFEPELVVRESA